MTITARPYRKALGENRTGTACRFSLRCSRRVAHTTVCADAATEENSIGTRFDPRKPRALRLIGERIARPEYRLPHRRSLWLWPSKPARAPGVHDRRGMRAPCPTRRKAGRDSVPARWPGTGSIASR
jgi:hypothetical protein